MKNKKVKVTRKERGIYSTNLLVQTKGSTEKSEVEIVISVNEKSHWNVTGFTAGFSSKKDAVSMLNAIMGFEDKSYDDCIFSYKETN